MLEDLAHIETDLSSEDTGPSDRTRDVNQFYDETTKAEPTRRRCRECKWVLSLPDDVRP